MILSVVEYALIIQETAHAVAEFIISSTRSALCNDLTLNHARAKYGDSMSVKSACYQTGFIRKCK